MSQNVAPETHIQFNETSFTTSQSGNHESANHMGQTSLENGDVEKQGGDDFARKPIGNADEGDEYTKLVRYISTYNEGGRRKSTASQLSGAGAQKRPWWKCWGGKKAEEQKTDDAFEVPDEWIETDIKTGITTNEVEARRKKTGWNELTTEKANLFLQFLSYFQGPILYGELNRTRTSRIAVF